MKNPLLFLTSNALALALVGLAAYLIYLNRPGWGWVVFAALCTQVVPAVKSRGGADGV